MELSAEVREACIEAMLRRVNQAQEATGQSTYEELEPCEPFSCMDCVLSHHVNLIRLAYPDAVYVHGTPAARAIAEAWGVVLTGQPREYLGEVRVALPMDLVMATAAFDAEQIPELVVEGFSSPAIRSNPVSEAAIRQWVPSVDG